MSKGVERFEIALGQGNDIAIFGDYADIAYGLGGDDCLLMGAGTYESLDFSALDIGFDDLTIAQNGADTLILTAAGDSVLLVGVNASDLNATDDFVF